MLSPKSITTLVMAFLLAIAASATTTNTKTSPKSKTASSGHSSSSHKSSSNHSKSTKKKSAKSHGQQGIDHERTRAIQEALVREHYLTGEPSGVWDAQTKDALARYQEANGWQTKSMPDSRALIKLGLGPDKKGLLNPDTAYMPTAHELGTEHETQPGGSAQR